jgi:hypothetical protein
MVTGPKNSDPEKRFTGSSWHFHLHNLNGIHLNIKPSIDFSLKVAVEWPWHRRGRAQQPAQRDNKYIY